MNYKKILLGLLVVVILGMGYGYYLFNKPVSSLANERPAYVIGASQLVDQYEADESKANSKYLDQIIEVSGAVAKIVESKSIYLDTGNPLSSVICELADPSEANKVKTGDLIKVKGLCSGYLMDVVLVRSVIVP